MWLEQHILPCIVWKYSSDIMVYTTLYEPIKSCYFQIVFESVVSNKGGVTPHVRTRLHDLFMFLVACFSYGVLYYL